MIISLSRALILSLSNANQEHLHLTTVILVTNILAYKSPPCTRYTTSNKCCNRLNLETLYFVIGSILHFCFRKIRKRPFQNNHLVKNLVFYNAYTDPSHIFFVNIVYKSLKRSISHTVQANIVTPT